MPFRTATDFTIYNITDQWKQANPLNGRFLNPASASYDISPHYS